MQKRLRFGLAAVAALAAVAVLGVGSASAHGGKGYGSVSTSALVKAAATQLNVTPAKLKAAILDSANARIDEAVADEDLTADEAADLKDEAADNLNVAYSLSRASKVASSLSITATQLNNGFRAARKALLLARIDKAVAAGDLTRDEAASLKQELDSATLPGYKPSSGLGLGLGGGRGHGGGPGGGPGGFAGGIGGGGFGQGFHR